MASSADIGLRLLREEFEVFKKSVVDQLARIRNPFADELSTVEARPDAPTGLTVSENLGSIVLRWNPLSTSNLRRYEVQRATNDAFTVNVVTESTTRTHLDFNDGDPGVTYHFHVRGIHDNGSAGPWSPRLSVVLKQVENGDLAIDSVETTNLRPVAATGLHSAVYDANNTLTVSGSASDAYETTDTGSPLSIVVADSNSIILPFVNGSYTLGPFTYNAGQHELRIYLERRREGKPDWTTAVVVDQTVTDFFTSISSSQRTPLPFFTSFDQPLNGSTETNVEFEYRVRFELESNNAGNSSTVYVDDISLEFIQLKR